MSIYSQPVERRVLSGLIKYPEVFPEIDRFISAKDFFMGVHQTIYVVITQAIHNDEVLDKVLIADKIKNLGIKHKDDIDIFEYIDDLTFTQITKEATVKSSQELKVYTLRRDFHNAGEELKEEMRTNGSKPPSEIVSSAEVIVHGLANSYTEENAPVKLTENLVDMIEDRGNNPIDEIGFKTPFENLNKMYGGARIGHVFSVASRAKQGKSTLLLHMAFEMSKINDCKVLFLDTEMMTEEVMFRRAAALIDINPWFLETGKWRKNASMIERVRNCKKLNDQYEVYHMPVGELDIDGVCSLIRAFKYKRVKRGTPFIVVYDYLKLTGEKMSNNWAEHQALGDKVSRLKSCAVEVEAALITACQMNRSAEVKNRNSSQVADDMSAIASSDRISWFSGQVFIFRKKTEDELHLDNSYGVDFGTHKLINVAARFQGEAAAGFRDELTRTLEDGKTQRTESNYINFDVRNFNVSEKGTLQDIVNRERNLNRPNDFVSEDDLVLEGE